MGLRFLIRCFFAFTKELMRRTGGPVFSFGQNSWRESPRRIRRLLEFPAASVAQKQERKRRASARIRLVATLAIPALAVFSHAEEAESRHDSDFEIQQLRTLVRELQTRVEQLEEERRLRAVAGDPSSAGHTPMQQRADEQSANTSPSAIPDERSILDFIRATTINVG